MAGGFSPSLFQGDVVRKDKPGMTARKVAPSIATLFAKVVMDKVLPPTIGSYGSKVALLQIQTGR